MSINVCIRGNCEEPRDHTTTMPSCIKESWESYLAISCICWKESWSQAKENYETPIVYSDNFMFSIIMTSVSQKTLYHGPKSHLSG